MKKLIVANWKMNPSTLAEALALGKACDYEGVVLCVPFPYILPLQQILQHAKLGAQDVAAHDQGAFTQHQNLGAGYTGQVSASMLKDAGCEYVIVGHSERRRDCGETDVVVQQKLNAALTTGLLPILCVKEPEPDFIISYNLPPKPYPLVLAYEPEGAISTHGGRALSLQDITKACERIHGVVPSAMVLYGGSVDGMNAKDILALPWVDGVLVGAASLTPEEFQKIITYGNC